ncbi:MAG: diphthine synthase [Nanoarchaeota archaeon]|nr:diphthine synthase [Nanoarchaeota archaeon]
MLSLIGIGLSDEKDITVKGLEIVRSADVVYLEGYTSLLQCSIQDLEEFYQKKVIAANRETVESDTLVDEAVDKNVVLLIIGDPFSATTHVEMASACKEKNIEFQVVHNASVLTAIGETGLQLYKFGRTASIPFIEDHPNLETPYNILRQNKLLDMHTLFLLDLKPEQNRFMIVSEALQILEQIESRKQEKVISDDLLVVGCARLGSDSIIKAGKLSDIKKFDFGKPLHSLIIPGDLHFVEEEYLHLL